MLIVLEGCDKVGKTTLARKIVDYVTDELDGTGEIWKRGVPERHPLEEYELDLEAGYYPGSYDRPHVVVCDRWHIGELVYGPLYRGESKLGPGGAWHVDALIQSLGAVQTILVEEIWTILERMGRDGEDYLQKEHVRYVVDAYRDLQDAFPWIWTAATTDADRSFVETLVWEAGLREHKARRLVPFTTYVGPLEPDILLLGDRRNGGNVPDRIPPGHRAAFVPYSGTSGKWLCEAIALTDLRNREIGIANGCEENVAELVHALGSPRVVALGDAAAQACANVTCEHGRVPHPQWARRFKHHEQNVYAKAIERAADAREAVRPW